MAEINEQRIRKIEYAINTIDKRLLSIEKKLQRIKITL